MVILFLILGLIETFGLDRFGVTDYYDPSLTKYFKNDAEI